MAKKLSDDMIVTKKLTGRRSFIKAGVGFFTMAGLALGSRKALAEPDEDKTESDTDASENDADQTDVDKSETDSDKN